MSQMTIYKIKWSIDIFTFYSIWNICHAVTKVFFQMSHFLPWKRDLKYQKHY